MTPLSETEKRVIADIEMYGWHVINVPEDEFGPSFGYTVGLMHSFEHPEILIIGLALETIHFILNKLGDNIRDGLIIQSGHFYSNIIDNLDCYFTVVEPKYFNTYASYNEWYYKGRELTILQCIYPTFDNIYPWQLKRTVEGLNQQPVLGELPS